MQSVSVCICDADWRRSGCLVKVKVGSFVPVSIGSLYSISPQSVHSTPALRYVWVHTLTAMALYGSHTHTSTSTQNPLHN